MKSTGKQFQLWPLLPNESERFPINKLLAHEEASDNCFGFSRSCLRRRFLVAAAQSAIHPPAATSAPSSNHPEDERRRHTEDSFDRLSWRSAPTWRLVGTDRLLGFPIG